MSFEFCEQEKTFNVVETKQATFIIHLLTLSVITTRELQFPMPHLISKTKNYDKQWKVRSGLFNFL